MTDAEALTHAIQEINRHWHCSGRSPERHKQAIEILARLRTDSTRYSFIRSWAEKYKQGV